MAATAKKLAQLGLIYDDRRDFYISPQVVQELWPDVTPFTTVISNRGMRKVGDPDFKMFEHRSSFVKQECTINDGTPPAWAVLGAAGDTLGENITVNGIVGLNSTVDNSWKNLVFEVYASDGTTYKGLILAQDVSSAKIVGVSLGNPRSASGVCAALADNDIMRVVGNAHGEGTSAPDAWADDIEVVYNSTQIFKTPIQVTGTLYEAALRGYSSELERLRIEKAKEHKYQKEKAFLLGVRAGGTGMTDLASDNTNSDAHGGTGSHVTDADGNTVRTTMGIIPTLYRYGTATGDYQNLFTISKAAYAYENFVDDMEKVFQFVPDDGMKIAFCGATALSYWSKVDATQGFHKLSGFSVQIDGWQRDSLGFRFKELVTPHGIVKLVYAPALRGPYASTMLVVDPGNLELVQYRPSKLQMNIKTDNAFDGVKDMYFSDEGVGTTLIEKHSLFNIVA